MITFEGIRAAHMRYVVKNKIKNYFYKIADFH